MIIENIFTLIILIRKIIIVISNYIMYKINNNNINTGSSIFKYIRVYKNQPRKLILFLIVD